MIFDQKRSSLPAGGDAGRTAPDWDEDDVGTRLRLAASCFSSDAVLTLMEVSASALRDGEKNKGGAKKSAAVSATTPELTTESGAPRSGAGSTEMRSLATTVPSQMLPAYNATRHAVACVVGCSIAMASAGGTPPPTCWPRRCGRRRRRRLRRQGREWESVLTGLVYPTTFDSFHPVRAAAAGVVAALYPPPPPPGVGAAGCTCPRPRLVLEIQIKSRGATSSSLFHSTRSPSHAHPADAPRAPMYSNQASTTQVPKTDVHTRYDQSFVTRLCSRRRMP